MLSENPNLTAGSGFFYRLPGNRFLIQSCGILVLLYHCDFENDASIP